MSYFDDASLVMIPSGYKTSKVYSVKPTSGDGDLTFTRSNDTATRVAANGLIEKVRTNLALYSQDFSQTGTWVTSTTTRVDSQTDPNGGTTASKFTATGANSNVIQTRTVSSGIPYTWSFYAKSDSATDVNIRLDNGNGNFVQTNMALTTSWQRFSITLNSNATTIQCYLGGGLSFTTGEVVYIAFAQLETGDVMTDYIATTSAAVSVGPVANVPRLDYLGSSCPRLLLEPQRTNLALYSEQINQWDNNGSVTKTANYAISPDGYQNADRVVFSAGSEYIRTTATGTSATYTGSVWIKGTAGQTIQLGVCNNDSGLISLTGDWQRISHTHTAVSDYLYVHTYGGATARDILVWGAQLEAGAYATSYIPTLGAAVTRGVDSAQKTSASALIGQTEGTIFWEAEFTTMVATGHEGVLNIDDGTFGDTIYLFKGSTGNFVAEMYIGGVQQASFSTSAKPIGTYKMALAYANNNTAFFLNGEQIGTTDTSCSIPATNRIQLGNGALGPSTDRTAQVLLFPTRLTNAQLAELTTI